MIERGLFFFFFYFLEREFSKNYLKNLIERKKNLKRNRKKSFVDVKAKKHILNFHFLIDNNKIDIREMKEDGFIDDESIAHIFSLL